MNTQRQNHLNDIALLMIRTVLAVVFIFHGGQMLFGLFGGHGLSATAAWMGSIGIPVPTFSALAAGSTEFFGGIVLLLGVGARIAAIPMTFNMIVAIVTAHLSAFDVRQGGMEYALTLAVVLAAIALMGPGSLTARRLLQAIRGAAVNSPSPATARTA